MKKIFLALAFLFGAVSSQAQNSTTVTINVTDSGGVAWASGSYTMSFVGDANASWPGGNLARVLSGSLNGSGSAARSTPSNATIQPTPSFWRVQVCPSAAVTVTTCFTQQFSISGATQTLTMTPPALSIVVPLTATQINPVTAYADAEISGGWVGFTYYSVTSSALRVCTAVNASGCTTWAGVGGAGGSVAGSNTQVQFNDSAAFGGDAGLTYNKASSLLTIGSAGGTTGQTKYVGTTSGSATVGVAAVAGTPNKVLWPTATGTSGQCLQTDGANPQQTSWASNCGVGGLLTTLGDLIAEDATPTPVRLPGPTTPNGVPQILTDTPSGGLATAVAWALPGVPTNAQTAASYTVTAIDRASYVTFSNAGAIAVTLPQANSAGFGSNFVFAACDIGAGTATITPTTSTISYTTGVPPYVSAASSMPLTTGQCAWIYSDNTNYFAILRGGVPVFPITVAGTANSGGIPYFNSATQESSSAALTANAYVKGGGAGVAPSVGLTTDDGVTSTYIGSGGTKSPVFTATGTTAGFTAYTQGSTSSAVAPCSNATTICEQAPAAVTSYLVTKPGVAPSGIVLNSNNSNAVTQSTSGDTNHSVHVTAQTATKTIYTLCPASAGGCNVAGQYRVTWYFNQGGTACGTPTPGQVTFALSWTDNAGAHSAIALPMNDNSSIAVFTSAFKFASTNATGFASGEFNLWSTGAQPIQVTNTYTACGVGTGTWELTAAVEQVQ